MKITGNAAGNYLGYALSSGDFDADGKVDLAAGEPNYDSGKGVFQIIISEVKKALNEVGKMRGTLNARGNLRFK
jgi:hypothetical protein